MKAVRFLEEAQDEFLEQISYYEEHQKGLGDQFRESVAAATALASVRPKLGSPRKLRKRRVFPKGFPFSVVYLVGAYAHQSGPRMNVYVAAGLHRWQCQSRI